MSFPFSWHASLLELESFATDGHAAVTARVQRHLASCARCQDGVRSMRALRRAIRALPTPPASGELLASIERRIAADDLVLLPPSHTGASTRRVSPVVFLLPLAAAMLVALLLFWPNHARLEAGSTVGQLTVTTHAPREPNTLAIRYEPAIALAASDSVILRADLFSAGQFQASSHPRYVLHRRDGTFSGDVPLPSGAALASFTLASADGTRIDDNDGRAWEFVARDSTNRPTFDGLTVQHNLHSFDDWERSFAAAKDMMRFYPEQPAGVRSVLGASLQLVGAGAADSVIRELRPQVEALHRRYATQAASADVVWQMVMLANQIGDTTMARFWFERTKREYPREAGTIQLRVFDIFKRKMSDVDRLRALDRLWDETGGGAIQLAADAFRLADKLGDVGAIERWGDRFATYAGYASGTASTFLRYDTLRPKGETMLRAALQALPPLTRTDWSAALNEKAGTRGGARGQWQLTALGDALLRDGKLAAARDTLRRAAAAAWDAGALSLLADAALAAADTAEAARAYAWTIADGHTTSARADTIRTRLGAWATRADFEAHVAEGRAIVRETVLASTYRRPLTRAATFADGRGARRALADALPPGIGVIAVISRSCAPSLSDLPKLQQMRDQLALRGVPVLVVVAEEPNENATKAIARAGYVAALGFDDRAEVSRGLRQYGTPQYFVVEDGKTIRADTRRAMDLAAVIDALRPQ